jgi:hypothetical protein
MRTVAAVLMIAAVLSSVIQAFLQGPNPLPYVRLEGTLPPLLGQLRMGFHRIKLFGGNDVYAVNSRLRSRHPNCCWGGSPSCETKTWHIVGGHEGTHAGQPGLDRVPRARVGSKAMVTVHRSSWGSWRVCFVVDRDTIQISELGIPVP